MAPGVIFAPGPPTASVSREAPREATLLPAAAVVAARAEALAGKPFRALALLRQALPGAGKLTPLLQLEAAELKVKMRQDPWSYLAPLLQSGTPDSLRRRAQQIVLQAVRELPLPKAKKWATRPLSRSLRRRIQGELALRERKPQVILQWLRENPKDPAAGPLALALPWEGLDLTNRAWVGQALFFSGFWRESYELFRSFPYSPTESFDVSFIRARTAYRLELWEEAENWFAKAAENAPTREDRAASLVFQARSWEQMGNGACAEELYHRAINVQPELPEGWQGLFGLLARLRRGEEAVRLWGKAPSNLRQQLAPKLCAALVLHGELRSAQELLNVANSPEPAMKLCQAIVASNLGSTLVVRQKLEEVMADPRSGRLRDLAAWMLPEGRSSGFPNPTQKPEVLGHISVIQGLRAARDALDLALAHDERFAFLLRDGPQHPLLPASITALLAEGLSKEAAWLFPHHLPGETPEELAWKAAFLAENENWSDALAAGEELWRVVGDVPACLLPDALLRFIVPQKFSTLFASTEAKSLLFAIARQESRFNHQALSPVGARGFLQIMPETSRRLGRSPLTPLSLDEATVLASRYLELLSSRLGADPALLGAAYNAGESWVRLWLGDSVAPGPIFPLAVPYRETQGYVLGVLEGLWLSRHLR